MDERQLQALLVYIDARIAARDRVDNPFAGPKAEALCEEAKDHLCKQLGIDHDLIWLPS